MLDHLLRQAQQFERRHGKQPNVVYLNEVHYHQLLTECPALFSEDPATNLGFTIAIIAQESLPHPRVAWFPSSPQPLRAETQLAAASSEENVGQ